LIPVYLNLLGIFEERIDFGFEFIVEFHIFVLIVPGAPIVQVAINAVLNLDMHHDWINNFIDQINTPILKIATST
jgi:hypothetical protein